MTGGRGTVLLTGTGVEHRFVARELADGPGLDAIIVVDPPAGPRVERVRKAWRRFGTLGLLERTATRALLAATGHRRRRHRTLVAVLGTPDLPGSVPRIRVPEVNGRDTIDALRRLGPEVLCVYGTPVVADRVLACAPTALNLHTGISPQYRGSDCAFWPLYFREPHLLGATVHDCTSDIDGGSVHGTVRAHVHPDDGIDAVFARCVLAGGRLYARVVADVLAGASTSTPQDLAQGREFRASMRDWRAQLVVWRNLRDGLLRNGTHAGAAATLTEVR